MNCGNDSNCVHWLYAVVTGTSTSIDWVMLLIRTPPVGGSSWTATRYPPSAQRRTNLCVQSITRHKPTWHGRYARQTEKADRRRGDEAQPVAGHRCRRRHERSRQRQAERRTELGGGVEETRGHPALAVGHRGQPRGGGRDRRDAQPQTHHREGTDQQQGS